MELNKTTFHEIHEAGSKILSFLDSICTDQNIIQYDLVIIDEMNRSSESITGISYVFKYNHMMSHDSKVIYTDALVRWMIALNIYKIGVMLPKTGTAFTFEIEPVKHVSLMGIATYRVKVLPDDIMLGVDERDLYHLIYSKKFSDSKDATDYKICMVNISVKYTSHEIITNCDNLDATDIKDALIRHQPSFHDNYFLDVILYHDYLKNVVIGHMRRSMIEIINNICRENLKMMADTDGDC